MISVFEKLTLIFIFFPYVAFLFKTNSDVQPYYFIAGCILLLLLIANKVKFKMSHYHWFIFLTVVVMSLNLSFHFLFGKPQLLIIFARLVFKYLAFLLLFLLTERLWKHINYKLLFNVTATYFAISNLQVMLKKPIIGFLLSRCSYNPNRNLAKGLTPEASFLAKICVFFILILEYLLATNKISKNQYYLLLLLNIEMILISQSLSGYFLILIYFLIKIFLKPFKFLIKNRENTTLTFSSTKLFLSYLSIGFFLFLALYFKDDIASFLSSGRIGMIYNYIVNKKSIILFFLEDRSFLARVNVVKTAFESLKSNFFGYLPLRPYGGFFSFIIENGIYGIIFAFIYFFNFIRIVKNSKKIKPNLYDYLVTVSIFYPIYVFVDTMAAPFFILLLCVIYKFDSIIKEEVEITKHLVQQNLSRKKHKTFKKGINESYGNISIFN